MERQGTWRRSLGPGGEAPVHSSGRPHGSGGAGKSRRGSVGSGSGGCCGGPAHPGHRLFRLCLRLAGPADPLCGPEGLSVPSRSPAGGRRLRRRPSVFSGSVYGYLHFPDLPLRIYGGAHLFSSAHFIQLLRGPGLPSGASKLCKPKGAGGYDPTGPAGEPGGGGGPGSCTPPISGGCGP